MIIRMEIQVVVLFFFFYHKGDNLYLFIPHTEQDISLY